MAHYQITLDEPLFTHLFAENGGIAPLMEQILNQVLQAQVAEHLAAKPHERNQQRTGYRNGYRERPLQTRIGTLTLQVPRVRSGNFTTEMFERYQRSEQALLIALVERVIQGVSTRKVDAVVETLCGAEVSKSTVSALYARLDPIVKAWRERKLDQTTFPFVIVDAIVIRVREERVRQKSLLIATGINADGYREILGMWLGDSESEASWAAFFASLKERGLSGVDLVTSDNHAGLVKAVHTQFQGASWQRCQAHLSRNLSDACPDSEWESFHASLRGVLEASDVSGARGVFSQMKVQFSSRCEKALSLLENCFSEATAVLSFPLCYRRRLRTTNSVERLNEEIRRRERVIRIFPNEASVIRLMGALLMEFDENWSTGKRYFEMDAYRRWKQEEQEQQQQKAAAAEPLVQVLTDCQMAPVI